MDEPMAPVFQIQVIGGINPGIGFTEILPLGLVL
jgi:hypothetical protein